MSISQNNSVSCCDGEKGLLNRIGRAGKNKLLIGLHSADLVDAAYQGLLGREPDPEGFAAYKEELAGCRDLAGIIRDIAHSDEFRQKSIAERAPDLVRAIYLALLGREPEEEGLVSYAAQVTELDKIIALFAEIANSEEFWNKLLAARSPDLVRAIYLSLLGREPEEEGLASYAAQVTGLDRIAAVFAEIANSEEFWGKLLAARSPGLIRAAFIGLLKREPDPEGLESYSRELSENGDLSAILKDIIESKEFAEITRASAPTFSAGELVRQIFIGLLKREPDEEGLASYSRELSEKGDLPAILADIIGSKEFTEKIGASAPTKKGIGFSSEELARQIFSGLLKREPDAGGLDSYAKLLQSPGGLETILSNVIESSEFASCYAKANSKVHPDTTYNKPCLVFIHIQKTAGTSVQHHLHDCFSEDELYRENADNIWALSPSQLSKYRAFAGHFNYDTLRYIPRKKLSIFTFVRKPKSRLQSLYYYYRSHEPGNMFYSELVQLADRVTIEEFFENELIDRNPQGVWNNMYWAVMGKEDWRKWMQIVVKEKNKSAIAEALENKIRLEIAQRLQEFTFIGLQEDFERSLLMLFRMLNMRAPDKIRTDNSLEQISTKPHFKKVEKQPVTPRLDSALDKLVELDNVVYEEAEKLYQKRLVEFGFKAV